MVQVGEKYYTPHIHPTDVQFNALQNIDITFYVPGTLAWTTEPPGTQEIKNMHIYVSITTWTEVLRIPSSTRPDLQIMTTHFMS